MLYILREIERWMSPMSMAASESFRIHVPLFCISKTVYFARVLFRGLNLCQDVFWTDVFTSSKRYIDLCTIYVALCVFAATLFWILGWSCVTSVGTRSTPATGRDSVVSTARWGVIQLLPVVLSVIYLKRFITGRGLVCIWVDNNIMHWIQSNLPALVKDPLEELPMYCGPANVNLAFGVMILILSDLKYNTLAYSKNNHTYPQMTGWNSEGVGYDKTVEFIN